MELPRPFNLMQLPYSFLFLFSLIFSMNSMVLGTQATFTNATDRLSLIAFKDSITHDPYGILTSWNDSVHFCEWVGVKCGRRHQRVIVLNLNSQGLVGSISPYIGNLTFLRGLGLHNNSLHGEIPHEVGNLVQLQDFKISNNSFGGKLPVTLSHCSELQTISMDYNKIGGTLPPQLGSLSNLLSLTINRNNLDGQIPSTFGNLSSLKSLSLTYNMLVGSIPSNLGGLTSLEHLNLVGNRLTGTIPLSVYNLSSLKIFAMDTNQLHGNIPPDVGLTLTNLRSFSVGNNHFSGLIPSSLANASSLERLQFTLNNFSGPVPNSLGDLQSLNWLGLGGNNLGNRKADDLSFITSLTNCTSLGLLQIGVNNFGGVLPKSVGNLSTQLAFLVLGRNYISGNIPMEIGNLLGLTVLVLQESLFTGSIPSSIGRLQNLSALLLGKNKFSGPISSSLSNITSLITLSLDNNRLQGNIPANLGKLRNLQELDLSYNNLRGVIPDQVFTLPSLSISLDLSENSFSGPLPRQVGKLKHIGKLFLMNNKLTGKIPSELGDCESLEYLVLSGNHLEGTIPVSFSNLKGLLGLDLSRNNLSGQIPNYMGELFFQSLNLSYNDFEGVVPKEGVFRNVSAFSVIENNKLCGGISELLLPVCIISASKKHGNSSPLKVIIPVILVVVGLIIVACFFVVVYGRRSSRKMPSSISSPDHRHLRISYSELLKATDGFSSSNLIGVGSYGAVYKGVLKDDTRNVAVKVFNLQKHGAPKSFIAECNALRYIRHRNLNKILTACSGVDFKGNDFKALVLEFMENGSLNDWLHPDVNGQGPLRNLTLVQRLNMAIDVASALDYLYNRCEPQIVHRDLKPSNILIDADMIAHVGDFGLAKFISGDLSSLNQNQTTSIAITGSIGYVAPEYALSGQASTQGDIYSYGIMLLEMFIGKRPTNDMFKEGLNLHNFAKMALPEQVMEIVDPRLHIEEQFDEGLNNAPIQRELRGRMHLNVSFTQKDATVKMHECLVSMLKVGVACSSDLPKERMDIKDVIRELITAKEVFLGVGIHRERHNETEAEGEGTSYHVY